MSSFDFEKSVMQESKKKKKSRKEKKSKKHRSSKKKRMSSSESASESDEMEWVEVTAERKKPEIQREDWMAQETFVPTLSKEEMLGKDPNYRRKTGHKDQKQGFYKPGQHERELNPYWKNDGKGVPEDDEDSSLDVKLPSTSVGDGGLSWLKKAYKRIEEQAEEEGRKMEDVAVERWGSLDKLKSLIAEAEKRMKTNTHHAWRHKERYHDRCEYGRKREYSHDQEKRDSSHRKSEKGHEIRHEQKTFANKSYDKNMFKRPSQENTDERKESCHTAQSSHQPAWKKKKPIPEPLVSDEHTPAESNFKSSDSSYSKKSSDSEEKPINIPVEEAVFMTDNEMNNLAAKILKAEMRGNNEVAAQLQSKLDAARNARKTSVPAAGCLERKRSEDVILSKVDTHGIARPLIAPDYSINAHRKKGGSGEKMSKIRSYFSEESEHSLKKMFEREKLTTADDQIEMFVDAAMESKGLTDQDYEIGDISAKVAKKMGQQRRDERDYNKAIQEHKRLNTALEKCEYCFEKMKKHLVISDSPQAYLCLPSYESLTEGHCLIVPKGHTSSSLLLDEDVAEEIQNFKKMLVGVFKERGQCVAFVETSMNLRYSPHLVIECFPMPTDVADMAPMYFKKAIQEHGSEWSNNKKLIDLFKKDLKYSVPKGLPFFAVQFSQGGGYAHIIEDKHFPKHFGKEIIGGMLEIDSHLCARYRKEDFKEHAKKVLNFTKIWKAYTNKVNIEV